MPSRNNEIIELEKQFFQAMVDKDGETATSLCADEVVVAGPQGAVPVKGADMGAMMAQGKWELHKFDLKDVKVTFPAENIAVIGYKAVQDMSVEGKRMKFKAADTSTWIKNKGRWLCVQHSESPIGDPYGRK